MQTHSKKNKCAFGEEKVCTTRVVASLSGIGGSQGKKSHQIENIQNEMCKLSWRVTIASSELGVWVSLLGSWLLLGG
ncbi:hypothetical protein Droror1_Dr00011063 [Drosera rotundifolia]